MPPPLLIASLLLLNLLPWVLSLDALLWQEAGIPKGAARSIGISVDYRRRNRCLESLQV